MSVLEFNPWGSSGQGERIAVPAEPPTPVGRVAWLSSLGTAMSLGATVKRGKTATRLSPNHLGYAVLFTNPRGKWDWSTGRQTAGQTPSWLEQTTGQPESSWRRHLTELCEAGWLVKIGTVKLGPRPTPLYQLTVPAAFPIAHP